MNPIQEYWKTRLDNCANALRQNNFEAFVAADVADARRIVLEEIVPKLEIKSVSWGGSATFVSTGLYEALRSLPGVSVVDTFEKKVTREEVIERRRQALLVDLFITGTNALTESGVLVNLDMIGNRVAALTFGPKHVIVITGRNKLVEDVADAMFRIKNYAAPVNAIRLEKKTPCAKTTACEDCSSPDRICNTWAITEKSYPKKRIQVVLINEDLGF
ncbi:MAG: lactate utilization protein [Syntrophobacteraceae bacterium]